MRTTYNIGGMPHLERLRLGAKFIPCGHHRNLNFHDHEFSELSIILHSTSTLHWVEGKSYPLQRGDVILMHPGKIHAYENTQELSLFNLLYEPENLPVPRLDGSGLYLFPMVMTPICTPEHSWEKPLTTLDEETLSEIETIVPQLNKELQEELPGKNLRAFSLFLNLLTLICRSGGTVQKNDSASPISGAINYLNNNYQHSINIDILVKQFNVSRRVFFRKFKELTGYSPLQYLLQQRLSAAEHLLRRTDLPLSAIAERCGFCDSNYLSKLFARHHHTSPGTFRKNNSEKNQNNDFGHNGSVSHRQQ